MARLPRYQESGLISADIPRMDFANLRESAQFSQTVASSLDRISQFAFGEVQKQRQKEDEILAIQVRAELEGEVQKRMADLTVQVETGQLNSPTKIQEEITSMRGLAMPLSEISPSQAQALMQSIATSGKSLMAKSSDILVKAYQAEIGVKVDGVNAALNKTLETAYEVTQDPEQIAQIVSAAQGKVYAQAAQAPALIPKALEDFEKVRKSAEHSAMSKYFGSDDFGASEAERLAKLARNDAGKFTESWKRKSEAERIEIKKRMDDASIAKINSKKRDVEAEKMANDEAYITDYKLYMTENDPRKRAQIARRLVQSADSVADIDRILKAPETGGDALLFSNLREDIDRGKITDYRQLQKFVGPNGLDKTQLDKLQTQLYSKRDKELSAIRSRIRDQSGIGTQVGFFDPKEARVVKSQAITDRFERLVEQAIKENEGLPADKAVPINYDKLLDAALKDYAETDEKNNVANEAKRKLALYADEAKKKKVEVTITQDTNIEDLRRLKVFNEDQLNGISKQIEILKNNQTK